MNNTHKYIIGAFVAALVVFLLWYFSNIVTYILIAAVFSIVGRPLVGLLTRARIGNSHLPRWSAALITMLTIWAGMVLFISIFIPLFFDKVNEFSSIEIPYFIESFREPLSVLQNFFDSMFAMKESDFSLADNIVKQINSLFNMQFINNLLSSTVSVVGETVIALFSISFIGFFFLKDDNMFVNMLVALFPVKYEMNVRHAMVSVTNLLIRYFTGLVIESTIIILVVSTAMMIWGMDASNAFFIGLTLGVLNVIPYIGPMIGIALSIFVGILDPISGYTAGSMAIIIAGTILTVKMCDDFVLQPILYSNSVKAHPLEIFLVILVAGSIAGVMGMLLAIPAYNVIRVFAKEFFNHLKLVRQLTDQI